MKYLIRYLFIVAGLLLFAGCGGSSSGGGDSSDQPPSSDFDPNGARVGLGIFALLHPSFEVETAFDILMESKAPAIAILPGVFGSDRSHYTQLVNDLRNSGKPPEITLYALCGPCRPPRREGSLVQFRKDLDVRALQSAIRFDEGVRGEFVNFLNTRIKPFVDQYPDLQFTVIPELEDNQTDESFKAMLDLTQLVFGGNSNVRILRNAVNSRISRQYGEDVVSVEIHTTSQAQAGALLQPGDAVSFDGQYFRLPGEEPGCERPNDASFDSVKALIREAINRNVDVYVWRHEWQGLPKCPGQGSLPPDQRNYIFENVGALKELMRLR